MKGYILLLFTAIFTLPLLAQTAPVCEGDRLENVVFSEIQVTEGVVFGVGVDVLNQEFNLLMDVYEPVGDDLDRRPVVVMAHGGSFIGGNRTNPLMVSTCTALAQRGYVAASIEYTLWPFLALGLPDSTDLIDVIVASMGNMKTAIRYFNEDGLNANTFGVNPDAIVAGGYSAGAIIACHQGILDESDELTDFVQDAIDDRGGFANLGTNLDFSDEILAVINFSGSIYDLDFIDENSAPIYSSHGDMDGTVPFTFGLTGGILTSNGSSNIADRYNELGLENELFVFEGGGHTDIFTDAPFEAPLAEMLDNLYTWNKEQVCQTITSSENLISTQASIFPNPVNGQINVRLPQEVSAAYTIEIYNQLGQLVYNSQSFHGPTAQISVAGMSNGMYYTKINFADTFSPLTKRVVIAN